MYLRQRIEQFCLKTNLSKNNGAFKINKYTNLRVVDIDDDMAMIMDTF